MSDARGMRGDRRGVRKRHCKHVKTLRAVNQNWVNNDRCGRETTDMGYKNAVPTHVRFDPLGLVHLQAPE